MMIENLTQKTSQNKKGWWNRRSAQMYIIVNVLRKLSIMCNQYYYVKDISDANRDYIKYTDLEIIMFLYQINVLCETFRSF